MAEPMKNRMFRLPDSDIELLDKMAETMSQTTGLTVTRSDALRVALREKAKSLGIKQPTGKPPAAPGRRGQK